MQQVQISSQAASVLVQAHAKGELWGLATHWTSDCFATAGDDGFLKLWNVKTRKVTALKDLGREARSVAFSATGELLAVGFSDGGFCVLDGKTLDEHAKQQHRYFSRLDVIASFISATRTI